MKKLIKNSDELIDFLKLPKELRENAKKGSQLFDFKVTKHFAENMEKGNPKDPLLLQVLPSLSEFVEKEGFVEDPVGEFGKQKIPGLLQKYQSRVLLILTGNCAVNCRYCFRRNFPYDDLQNIYKQLEEFSEQIEADKTIEEVILSGGDPLTLTDSQLEKVVLRLEKISHLKRLRIHTRFPIVSPERIGKELVNLLASSRFAVYFVVHSNHPNEMDKTVLEALKLLTKQGITVFNQMVLLRGINDSTEVLEKFLKLQVNNSILPYYLHKLDTVKGASHFDVSVEEGKKIIEELRKRLPGFAVPNFVVEKEGLPFKIPL
ncbi:EF-P beta-lysylation protein EpmB [bacterium]|nr:EF-P beta-lysylation protein EpmB [bacterium]